MYGCDTFRRRTDFTAASVFNWMDAPAPHSRRLRMLPDGVCVGRGGEAVASRVPKAFVIGLNITADLTS